MQAFLVELIRNFEFSLEVPYEKVRREGSGVMAPTLEGQVNKGVQLPFRLRPAQREES
jgi:hypothetical protein